MPRRAVTSAQDFEAALREASPGELVVVQFTAAWCGPCRQIEPRIEAFATQYPQVRFLIVDIDQLQDVARASAVTSIPTFHFYKNRALVDTLQGAVPDRLETLIRQHGTERKDPNGVPGYYDLAEFIDKKQIHCLNQSSKNTVHSILNKDDSYLESDVDEQLIIVIPFQQAVRIHSIKFTSSRADSAPRKIKLYANVPTLGFDEADDVPATQELELSADDVKGAVLPLRFVKFQSVNVLAIFVSSNQGDAETTTIDSITLIGKEHGATNMGNLQAKKE